MIITRKEVVVFRERCRWRAEICLGRGANFERVRSTTKLTPTQNTIVEGKDPKASISVGNQRILMTEDYHFHKRGCYR